ncbi:unnamed protein product [Lota lota]
MRGPVSRAVPLRRGPLHGLCTHSSLPQGLAGALRGAYPPRPGLAVAVQRAARCLTELTSSLTELMKSFKVREVEPVSSQTPVTAARSKLSAAAAGAERGVGGCGLYRRRNQWLYYTSSHPLDLCRFNYTTQPHLPFSPVLPAGARLHQPTTTCGRAWAWRGCATTTTTTARTALAGPPCNFDTSVGPRHGRDETLGNPRGGTAAGPVTATPTSAEGIKARLDRGQQSFAQGWSGTL